MKRKLDIESPTHLNPTPESKIGGRLKTSWATNEIIHKPNGSDNVDRD